MSHNLRIRESCALLGLVVALAWPCAAQMGLPAGAVAVVDGAPQAGARVSTLTNLADAARPVVFERPAAGGAGALVGLAEAGGRLDLRGISLRSGATVVAAVRLDGRDGARWLQAFSLVGAGAGGEGTGQASFYLARGRANPWFGRSDDLRVRRGGSWAAFSNAPESRVRILTLRLDPAGVSAAWVGKSRAFDVAATPESGPALATALAAVTHLQFGEPGYPAPAEGGLVRVWARALSDAEVGAAVDEAEARVVALGDPVRQPALYLDLFGDSITDPTNVESRLAPVQWPTHIEAPGVLGRIFARSASTLLASGVPNGPTVAAQVALAAEAAILPPRAARTAERLAVVFAGTNEISADLSTGLGSAEAVAALRTLVTGLRAAGYDRVAVATMLPRTTGAARPGMTQAEIDAWRDAYNGALRAGATGADVVWDVGGAPAMADPTDRALYADGIHPTVAGAARIAAHFEAAFAEELARPEGAPTVPTASESLPGPFLSDIRPNPVRGRAHVRVSAAGAVQVTLHDVLGRAVQTLYRGTASPATPLDIEIDGRGLAPGVYVLRVEGAAGEASRRLTVVR